MLKNKVVVLDTHLRWHTIGYRRLRVSLRGTQQLAGEAVVRLIRSGDDAFLFRKLHAEFLSVVKPRRMKPMSWRSLMPNRLAASAEPANEGAVFRQMSTKASMALEVTGVDTVGVAVVQLASTNRLDKASVRNNLSDMT